MTDQPFVHMRDDYGLLALTPPLPEVGSVLRKLEAQHALQFRREHAFVSTSLVGAEPAIRRWIMSL